MPEALDVAINGPGLLSRFQLPSGAIWYDITRLIVRRHAPHPTGIDRIEIEAASEAVLDFKDRVIFVAKVGADAAILTNSEAVEIIFYLRNKWRFGQAGNSKGKKNAAINIECRGLAGGAARYKSHSDGNVFSHFSEEIFIYCARKLRSVLFSSKFQVSSEQGSYVSLGHHGLARNNTLFRRFIYETGVSPFAYIHDIIPINYPEFQREAGGGILKSFISTLAAENTNFFANSECTASELRKHLSNTSINMKNKNLRVLYPHLPHVKDLINIWRENEIDANYESDYFVIIGTIEPRKNITFILNVWRSIVKTFKNKSPRLVIIGHMGWQNSETEAALIRSEELKPFVEWHRDACDDKIAHLLKGARAFLFPSHDEGLGIPLLEALSLNCPCIVSDIPAFREVASHHAVFLSPIDGVGWRREILELCKWLR